MSLPEGRAQDLPGLEVQRFGGHVVAATSMQLRQVVQADAETWMGVPEGRAQYIQAPVEQRLGLRVGTAPAQIISRFTEEECRLAKPKIPFLDQPRRGLRMRQQLLTAPPL